MKKSNTFLLFTILFVFITVSCTNVKTDDLPDGATVSTVKDIDGNVYRTIKIGTQTWMVENLKTTKYNDGTSIPNVTDNTAWKNLSTPAYCWYNNDAITYKSTYGALYNWYTVNTGKLAPAGCHVPTDAEWTTLISYVSANLGISGSVPKALAATTNWSTTQATLGVGNDLTKNNSSGFSGQPGGLRYPTFQSINWWGGWWSTTEHNVLTAGSVILADFVTGSGAITYPEKQVGQSVRCIKD